MAPDPEAIRDALAGFAGEGEAVMRWIVVAEVVGPNDAHYLVHRAGVSDDTERTPMTWEAVGMLRAALIAAEDQLREMTFEPPDDDDDDDDAG